MGRSESIPPWLRRVGIELLGWVLIVLGIAALVLPGPGLLTIAAGLLVLSLRYAWAKRLLVPVKLRALALARKAVLSLPRVVSSLTGCLALLTVGILWGIRPAMPGWWPWDEGWWLPGGWGPGSSLIASVAIGAALILYSYRRFGRGKEPA